SWTGEVCPAALKCKNWVGNILYYGIYHVLLIALEQIDHRNSDLVALDLDFALRHRLVVGQDGHRIVLMAVQLDHGAATHAQQLVHGDHRTAQDHRDFDFDIVNVGSHAAESYIVKTRPACRNMVSETLIWTPPPKPARTGRSATCRSPIRK